MRPLLRRGLIVLGAILLVSAAVQLVHYTYLTATMPGLQSSNPTPFPLLNFVINVFGLFVNAALYGAVGLLCLFAADHISPLRRGQVEEKV
jgi:hypothetical protein